MFSLEINVTFVKRDTQKGFWVLAHSSFQSFISYINKFFLFVVYKVMRAPPNSSKLQKIPVFFKLSETTELPSPLPPLSYRARWDYSTTCSFQRSCSRGLKSYSQESIPLSVTVAWKKSRYQCIHHSLGHGGPDTLHTSTTRRMFFLPSLVGPLDYFILR